MISTRSGQGYAKQADGTWKRFYQQQTDVFCIRDGEWQIRIGDEVLPTIWNSKGAAIAGLSTECKRRGIHELSKECWCSPTVETP